VAEVRIAAEPRSEFGKGAARRVRRSSRVPAVLYGRGVDPRHISLPGHDLMMALKTPNVLLRVDGLDGGAQLALPKAVQRDPIKGFLEHVDLLVVKSGQKVVVEVLVNLEGEIAPGGMIDHGLDTLSVEAEATHIPGAFTVSVEGMEVGSVVHAGDVELPSGTTLATDPDAVVVHVIAQPTAEEVEAELEEAEAEVGIEREEPAEETAEQAPAASESGEGTEG